MPSLTHSIGPSFFQSLLCDSYNLSRFKPRYSATSCVWRKKSRKNPTNRACRGDPGESDCDERLKRSGVSAFQDTKRPNVATLGTFGGTLRSCYRNSNAMADVQTVAIYARVSTRDRQETENQLRELRMYCRTQDWRIAGEYVDRESGGKADRPQFRQLFDDAHRRKFDMVLFWALDRFSREGVLRTLTYLNDLESCGVEFKSYTERYLDSSGLFKEAILAILATLAKQERIRLSERVKAGLDRARSEGRRLGRPRLPEATIAEIRQLHREGISKREIARRVRYSDGSGRRRLVGWGSVRRVLASGHCRIAQDITK